MYGERKVALHNPEVFEQWKPAGFDGLFHWEFLLPAFKGSGIAPMDIDATVERKGHLLFCETKGYGQAIPVGQSRTYTALWNKPGVSILHIIGKTPETINGYVFYDEREKPPITAYNEVGSAAYPVTPATYLDVLFLVRCWYRRADGLDEPTREEWDVECKEYCNEGWKQDPRIFAKPTQPCLLGSVFLNTSEPHETAATKLREKFGDAWVAKLKAAL